MGWLDKTDFDIPAGLTNPTPGLPGFKKSQPFVHWVSTTEVVVLWCAIGDTGAGIPNQLYAWPGAVDSAGALTLGSTADIVVVATLADDEFLVDVRALPDGGYTAETDFLSGS